MIEIDFHSMHHVLQGVGSRWDLKFDYEFDSLFC